jgi:hypothetical protein
MAFGANVVDLYPDRREAGPDNLRESFSLRIDPVSYRIEIVECWGAERQFNVHGAGHSKTDLEAIALALEELIQILRRPDVVIANLEVENGKDAGV